MEQPTETTLAVVGAWQEAANVRDVSRRLELSAPDIEQVGPRGSGFGHQLLREWIDRAGLTLVTLRTFARDDVVVLEQRGTWRDRASGTVTGERTLASAYRVDEQRRVARVARYDSLAETLAATRMDAADEVA
jgi:hypothetical protein